MHETIATVAQALLSARRHQCPVDATPYANSLASDADAYAVQQWVADHADWNIKNTPLYWKAGSPDAHTPLAYAALPPAGIWPSGHNVAALPWFQRGIEAEIALRLGTAVTAEDARHLSDQDALALLDAAAVALEIVDFRWQQGMQAPHWLKLADVQSHGGLVVGDWLPIAPLRQHDWSTQSAWVQLGKHASQCFSGTHTLGSPFRVLAGWLRHATERYGTVAAGTVVTTGTWCGLLEAQPGDTVRIGFDGLGEVHTQF